jgi:ubiquinone/menaquinone biosynthesis C-methylase UbiE
MCARLRAIPGAQVLQCDATKLPFANDSYNTVIANHMLYHLDDNGTALREFARVVRPGGQVAAALNGEDHLAELRALCEAIGWRGMVRGVTYNDVNAQTGPQTWRSSSTTSPLTRSSTTSRCPAPSLS